MMQHHIIIVSWKNPIYERILQLLILVWKFPKAITKNLNEISSQIECEWTTDKFGCYDKFKSDVSECSDHYQFPTTDEKEKKKKKESMGLRDTTRAQKKYILIVVGLKVGILCA